MSPLTLIPDGEKIVGAFLRARAEVAALDARVVGKTPEDTSDPWVRLTELDAKPIGGHRSDYAQEFYFQLDCYAGKSGGQPEARLVGRTVRALMMHELRAASHSGAVVTGADLRSSRRDPDDDFEPARERMILTFLVWMHNA